MAGVYRRVAAFRLGGGAQRLVLCQGDLTRWAGAAKPDAIVNAANERMLGGGGVDGAIHRAAGPALYAACKEVEQVAPGVRCPTGEARITGGFELPAAHVIHTVGPIYESDEVSEPLLASAYASSLALANQSKLKEVAFPAISCGVFRYPQGDAAGVALDECARGVCDLEAVTFVLFGDDTYAAFLGAAEARFDAVEAAADKGEGEGAAAAAAAETEIGAPESEPETKRQKNDGRAKNEAEAKGIGAGPGDAEAK